MILEIWWSDKLAKDRVKSFTKFIQEMAYRLIQGEARYGKPDKRQNYMTRMIMEMKHYKRTGNAESLLNIANYCWLENECPENSKYHFDPKVGSVTRGKI